MSNINKTADIKEIDTKKEKKKLWNLSLRKTIFSIVYVICFICIVFFVTNKIHQNPLEDNSSKGISLFGYWPVIVVTGSMEPNIEVNSVSLCKECDMKDIEVGEIAVFKYGNELITHRVISKEVDYFGNVDIVTKGDNNEFEDDIIITESMFKGKVVKTWNETAKVLSKYLIAPGEYDGLAIAQTFIWLIVSIGLIAFVTYYVWGFLVALAKMQFFKNEYNKSLDNYNEDISKLMEYETYMDKFSTNNNDSDAGELNENNVKHKESFKNKLIKVLIMREIKVLGESVKDYEKAIKRFKWLDEHLK